MIYDISCKSLIDVKPLQIRFNKRDEFIKVCLVLLGGEKYDFIYYRKKYLIGLKSGATYVFSHTYRKIKFDSYGSFPLEKKGFSYRYNTQ